MTLPQVSIDELSKKFDAVTESGVHGKRLNVGVTNIDLDLFERFPTANVQTLFAGTVINGLNERKWRYLASGVGSSYAKDTNSPTVSLTVGTADGCRAVRQSFYYIPYQPGKMQEILISFRMAAGKTNVKQRVGYFDDSNGLFLELDGTNLKFIRRTKITGAVVDNAINRADWDDPLDGTVDAHALDMTGSQLMRITFGWLGVAGFIVHFFIAGEWHMALMQTGTNDLDYDAVWTVNPNLPVRYEIINVGISASPTTMTTICADVNSIGGYQQQHLPATIQAYANPATVRQINGSVLGALITVRMKQGFAGVIAEPLDFSVRKAGVTVRIVVSIVLNGTVSDESYTSLGSESPFEYYIPGATISASNISGGTILKSWVFDDGSFTSELFNDIDQYLSHGIDNTAAGDKISLVISPSANSDVSAMINMGEIQ